MKSVLVTGSSGQLAQCIKDISTKDMKVNFIFVDVKDMDITNKTHIATYFENNTISYCINCAAYTAVDRAEDEVDLALSINFKGPENLVMFCKQYDTKLIHISTDFVFNGQKRTPYTELDKTDPISVYGQSKLKGELAVINNLKAYYLIRTSWLYSEYGHNFLKTMLRLAETRNDISVVNDQYGSPTYARDLAEFIIQLISDDNQNYGLYHFSNEGEATWYDFAKSIFLMTNKDVNLKPITTKEYPTPAKRPKYSVLDKTKLKKVFDIEIPHWKDSLKNCLNRINH